MPKINDQYGAYEIEVGYDEKREFVNVIVRVLEVDYTNEYIITLSINDAVRLIKELWESIKKLSMA